MFVLFNSTQPSNVLHYLDTSNWLIIAVTVTIEDSCTSINLSVCVFVCVCVRVLRACVFVCRSEHLLPKFWLINHESIIFEICVPAM